MTLSVAQSSSAYPGAQIERLEWIFAGVLMAGLLLLPALWNGFPLIYSDTGGYLSRPFEHSLLIGRSALYGAFLAAGIPFDFWPNVLIQAGAAAWTILLVVRTHELAARPKVAAGLTLFLTAATGLPWNASMLIPDVLAPVSALALHLLAFRRDALSRLESGGLVALLAFAFASHMGTLGLGAAMLAAYALLRPFAGRLRMARPRIAVPAAALGLGIALALFSNLAIAGKFAFTPGGINFVFGRLLQDGIVQRYLAEQCPDPSLRLCEHRAEIPDDANDWLWAWGTLFYKLGGPDEFGPEAQKIVVATLARYPGQHLATALQATGAQLLHLKTGGGVNPHDTQDAVWNLTRYAPGVMPRFKVARQQHDLFDFRLINILHVPIALGAFALLPLLLIAGIRRRVAPQAGALALTTLIALLANAAICGALSAIDDRYQSRMAWLAVLAVAIAANSLRIARVEGADATR
jgi:hypothetical protein